MTPEVTVMIPNYNSGQFLRKAIQSVRAQTYEGWKVIVVDDASTDNSLKFAKDKMALPNIRLVCNQVNIGQSKAMNVCLKHVDTRYCVQLDADDWFYPNTLEVLVNTARSLPNDVAVISGNISVHVDDGNGNLTYETTIKNRQYQDKYEYMLSNKSQWPRFYRTSALRAVGGWPADDPMQGRYVEDLHILYRLIEKYRFHWVDVPLYNHRRHANNQTNEKLNIRRSKEWIVRNALKRWGDKYEPVFREENGWLLLVDLKRK